jgi:charged multivesicular body protein 4
MNLFGKKKTTSAPTPAVNTVDTIKMLRDNLQLLEKREEHISKKIDVALQEAKVKHQKKDKNGALFCLKRKKMYEGEVAKLQGARLTMENQIAALESAAVNIETFKAMKAAQIAMKAQRGDIDADKVDDMMEDIQEEKDIHDSISEAISRPGQDLFDDQELLDELEQLDALDMELNPVAAPQSFPAVAVAPSSVFNLPSVPTASVASKQQPLAATSAESEEERALRELQASLA